MPRNRGGLSARPLATGSATIAPQTEAQRDWPLFALRLVVGYGFLAHGIAKAAKGPDKFAKLLHVVGVPFPVLSAWAVMLLEIAAGLALLIGVFVALASIPLIASMLVAMFTVHVHNGFSTVNTIGLTASGPVFGPPGYEINLLYIAALLVLATFGPGPLAMQTRKPGQQSG